MIDNPATGDLRVFEGHEIIELFWPGTYEHPAITMRATHVWTGEAWMKLSAIKEKAVKNES